MTKDLTNELTSKLVDRVNADFSRRVVIATHEMPWTASPQAGVERRLLDRIGGEVAKATSVVRYSPASNFPAHDHLLGEEFLVLDGVFADEHGSYAAGTYVRNPPGSHHAPHTVCGCTILVKLRQMNLVESERVVIDTANVEWIAGDTVGHTRLVLYDARLDAGSAAYPERVTMEKLVAGVQLPESSCPGGEEIFVLSGALEDGHEVYGAGTWIRNPVGYQHRLMSTEETVFWMKRGHLCPYDMR